MQIGQGFLIQFRFFFDYFFLRVKKKVIQRLIVCGKEIKNGCGDFRGNFLITE
jgi:hypothetical protein